MTPSLRSRLGTSVLAGLAVLSAPLLTAAPVRAEGVAGAYLAARQASIDNDYSAEAKYFTQALSGDPGNAGLQEATVVADIDLGDFDRAIPIAKAMQAAGSQSPIADIAVLAEALKTGAYDTAISRISAGKGVGPLIDGLITAWSQVGAGRMSDGLAAFDKLGQSPGLKEFSLYHKALAMASVGDFEGAAKIFGGGDPRILMTRRAIVAYAEVLSQLDRDKEGLALLDDKFGPEADPSVDPLRNRLKNGEAVPFDVVHNARDGASEVFFTVAAALKGEASDSFTLLYARIAQYLRPDNADATLLTADLLNAQKQYGLAIAAFGSVSRDDPAFYAAEQGKAQALYASGQIDAGIDAMKRLAEAHPTLTDVQVTLGDLLRRQERYAEALKAYDAAIGQISKPEQGDWSIFYMRGICQERLNDWSKSEADLREALKLNPDQPSVLNYLGYGMLERNEKLPEALSYIKDAVKARPDDGYIVDSLSWAYYRMGQYKEALPVAEHASQLEPVDAVVTDHLGDIYWANGRKLEARFQWHRALSFDPEPKDAARIKRKLEVGLDAALKEEGEAPLKQAQNGG